MDTPYFSIVIPTRNRPKLFRETLQSALLQDFDDFEVVVSDNSSDADTSAVIGAFRDNPRLSVFRPDDNLSMPKHWEFATLKARGRYVLVLTDRSVLRRHALRTIHAAICSSKQDVQVCSWRWSLFDDSLNLEFADYPVAQAGEILSLASRSIVQSFTMGVARYLYELPRGLNSCYRRELADEIRSKHGALFQPISPDFTSAFLLLAHAENVLFIDTALFISQGLGISNGGNAFLSNSVLEAYMSTLGKFDYYAHVPIKKSLSESLIFEDFLSIQEKAAGNLQGIALDWSHYFATCHREIEKRAKRYRATEEDQALMREWERALSTFDSVIQQEVKKKIGRSHGARAKAFLRNSLLGPYIVQTKRRFEVRGQAKRTILSHAGFSDVGQDK